MPKTPIFLRSRVESTAVAAGQSSAASWYWCSAWFVAMVVSISILTWDTPKSMVAIWLRSDTFAHGFLILPIAVWLVWEKRSELAALIPAPSVPVGLGVIPVGFVWMAARMVDVVVVEQFAYIALLVLAVWAVFGGRVFRVVGFPALFLFFAIPVGEGLVQPLINFTADFTVGMLKLVGIPVFREGTVFTIPSGRWSVVEACSGVRYLIASVTLGVLFAYLTYTRWYKRAIFLLFAIFVPILANGLRAFLIVLTGHLSDMKLATGVDHLIYGWVFFGLVILIMFSIGAIWKDDSAEPPSGSTEGQADLHRTADWAIRAPAAAVLFVALLLPWSGWAHSGGSGERVELGRTLGGKEIVELGGWNRVAGGGLEWSPEVVGAAEELDASFASQGDLVKVYLGVFPFHSDAAEMVTSANTMVSEESKRWERQSVGKVDIDIDACQLRVREYLASSNGEDDLVVWTWYLVGSTSTSNRYVAKFLELLERIGSPGGDRGVILAVATTFSDKAATGRARLTRFLETSGGELMAISEGRRIVDKSGAPGCGELDER